jgi:uncharacterized radical SAM superfamily Fe-S cluster-containing enzyme
MNELELLKEQWSEQMFEQRANGIQTESFEDWNHKRMIRMEFFNSSQAEREAAIKKANDDARMKFFNEWKNAESDAESIAEAMCS